MSVGGHPSVKFLAIARAIAQIVIIVVFIVGLAFGLSAILIDILTRLTQ